MMEKSIEMDLKREAAKKRRLSKTFYSTKYIEARLKVLFNLCAKKACS